MTPEQIQNWRDFLAISIKPNPAPPFLDMMLLLSTSLYLRFNCSEVSLLISSSALRVCKPVPENVFARVGERILRGEVDIMKCVERF